MFESEEKEDVHLIHCPPVIDVPDVAAMETIVKGWLIQPATIHVLDMMLVREIKSSAYRHFVMFNQALKANGKSLFCLNLDPKVQLILKQDGLMSVFMPVVSLDDAKRRVKGDKVSVDVEFINPFIMATRTVLEVQAQTLLTPGKAYLRKPTERIPMEIAGVIGISSHEFKGSISICFRAEVFLKIYENMVGEKHDSITREIEDAAGELLNIIFGQAKTILNDEKGYKIDKAIPTVLVGDKLKLHHQSRSPAIVLPFESPAGAFHLEILVDRS